MHKSKVALGAGQMVMRIFNSVALFALGILLVCLVASQGCHKVHTHPAECDVNERVDVEQLLRHVNGLNVLTNVLIAVPGIMLLVLGLPLEGTIVLMCTMFSCLWHASGWRTFGVVDQIFASLTAITMLLIFLRICQVRGYPEFTAFYLVLPLVGLMMFAAGDSPFITNDGSPRPNAPTAVAFRLVSHTLWHVLSAALFMVLVAELLRTPYLLPNRRLANTVSARDAQMRLRTWRARGKLGRGFNMTIVGGLFADLFAR